MIAAMTLTRHQNNRRCVAPLRGGSPVKSRPSNKKHRAVQAAAPAHEPRGFYDNWRDLLRSPAVRTDKDIYGILLGLGAQHERDLHVLNAYLQHALFTAAAATKAAEEMERQRSQLERSYAELSARCSDVTAISINTKAKFTAELARSCKIAEALAGALLKLTGGNISKDAIMTAAAAENGMDAINALFGPPLQTIVIDKEATNSSKDTPAPINTEGQAPKKPEVLEAPTKNPAATKTLAAINTTASGANNASLAAATKTPAAAAATAPGDGVEGSYSSKAPASSIIPAPSSPTPSDTKLVPITPGPLMAAPTGTTTGPKVTPPGPPAAAAAADKAAAAEPALASLKSSSSGSGSVWGSSKPEAALVDRRRSWSSGGSLKQLRPSTAGTAASSTGVVSVGVRRLSVCGSEGPAGAAAWSLLAAEGATCISKGATPSSLAATTTRAGVTPQAAPPASLAAKSPKGPAAESPKAPTASANSGPKTPAAQMISYKAAALKTLAPSTSSKGPSSPQPPRTNSPKGAAAAATTAAMSPTAAAGAGGGSPRHGVKGKKPRGRRSGRQSSQALRGNNGNKCNGNSNNSRGHNRS